MLKIILNNNEIIYVKDRLSNTIEVVLQDDSEYIPMKNKLSDKVLYKSKMYTLDDKFIGEITKTIVSGQDCKTDDGICWGIYNVVTVTESESKFITLQNELDNSNKLIKVLQSENDNYKQRIDALSEAVVELLLDYNKRKEEEIAYNNRPILSYDDESEDDSVRLHDEDIKTEETKVEIISKDISEINDFDEIE